MRTTITIDDKIAEDLLKISDAKNIPQAVREAVQEFIKFKKKQMLLSLSGKIDLDIDINELRKRELDELDLG